MDDQTFPTAGEVKKVIVVAVIITIILLSTVFVAYRYSKRYTSYVILPGGVTYTGPSQPPQQTPQPQTQITAGANEEWTQYLGKKYPYTFSYPKSLSLGVFPNDPFDSVTIFWKNTDSGKNLFLRVEDLQSETLKDYINEPKRKYVENWWKQYSFTGVASFKEFTNSKGFKGYRATYVDKSGNPSRYNYFFEIPNHPNLVIWMASDLIEASLFEKIADSVEWKE